MSYCCNIWMRNAAQVEESSADEKGKENIKNDKAMDFPEITLSYSELSYLEETFNSTSPFADLEALLPPTPSDLHTQLGQNQQQEVRDDVQSGKLQPEPRVPKLTQEQQLVVPSSSLSPMTSTTTTAVSTHRSNSEKAVVPRLSKRCNTNTKTKHTKLTSRTVAVSFGWLEVFFQASIQFLSLLNCLSRGIPNARLALPGLQ